MANVTLVLQRGEQSVREDFIYSEYKKNIFCGNVVDSVSSPASAEERLERKQARRNDLSSAGGRRDE